MSDKFTYKSGDFRLRPVPIASGVAIEIGDLLKLSGGKAFKMSAAADNLKFIGVAAQRHETTSPSGSITVYLPTPNTLFEYDLDTSTTITIFDNLAFSAAQVLTKNSTDPIATAEESKLSATKILCAFRLPDSSTIRYKGDAA